MASPQARELQNYLSGCVTCYFQRLSEASAWPQATEENLDGSQRIAWSPETPVSRSCTGYWSVLSRYQWFPPGLYSWAFVIVIAIPDTISPAQARAITHLLAQTQLQGPSVGTSECITLMDPFGNPRRILLDRLRTFQVRRFRLGYIKLLWLDFGSSQQFKAEIRNLYPPNTQRNHILQVCMDDNLFDICIDTGRQVCEIVDDQDLQMNAQPNMTLVMRILFFQTWFQKIEIFKCPLCNRINNIPKDSLGASIEW